MSPVLFGGGQERGLRPGTINTPGIVGFGQAIEKMAATANNYFQHIESLRNRLQHHLFSAIKGIRLNGCPINRHPGNLNLAIPMVSGEDVIGALPHIIFSTGSACTSGSSTPSHVISALGCDAYLANKALRFGINKFNTIEEIDYVGHAVVETVQMLQARRQKTSVN